jgi:CRISPR-associated protein Cmr6
MPLPKRLAELVGRVTTGFHPGLALDKHLDPPADAERQKPILQRVCSGLSDQNLLDSLNERRRHALSKADPVVWIGIGWGPLTLHLSRATALENAGVALHPLYGFAYLPGSGLKGLARAWAERIWLEVQPIRDEAVREIREIFGYAANSERGKSWIPPEISIVPEGNAGAVIFHDAWPPTWPRLIVDVVGVHHSKYYQAEEHLVPPPGDWEDPVPTTFLAVRAGTEFSFAVAPRRPEHARSARRAAEWLKAALADWGAGAKTAAGYGRIVSEQPPQPLASPLRARFECSLELLTPAFLAGAFQKAEDCDLRGATLRGQLRWWWRTMHAGHLEPRLLRRLETALWGAAGEGSAIQISLEPVEQRKPEQFRARDAVGYLAYGMREGARPMKPAGSKWVLAIAARAGEFRTNPKAEKVEASIEPSQVLEQASAALWLLTHYGGVGGKGRKGFGSLRDVAAGDIGTPQDCAKLAARLRHRLGLNPGGADRRVPSLDTMWRAEIPIRASDSGSALRAVAASYRDFVKSCDKPDRVILGLPRADRKIDMGLGKRVDRHPTTVHFHVAQSGEHLLLRMVGFEIERVVRGTDFFRAMEAVLRQSLGSDGPPGRGVSRGRPPPAPPPGGQSRAPAFSRSGPLLFRAGERVGNTDGEIGTVVSDVRVGETEMTVDIDGNLEVEKVRAWTRI